MIHHYKSFKSYQHWCFFCCCVGWLVLLTLAGVA